MINIRYKKMKSRTHPVSHFWKKTGTYHLATSPLSYLSHLARYYTRTCPTLPPPHYSPPSTFPNLLCHCSPTSPTLPPHYSTTCPTFPAHYSPTFPTFPAHYSPNFLSSAPSQWLKDHFKIAFPIRKSGKAFVTNSQAAIHLNWVMRCSLMLWDLAEGISITLIMGGCPFCFHGSSSAIKLQT